MEKLIRAKKIKISALIASAVLAVTSLVGIALFSLKLYYAPLVICIAAAMASIYAIPILCISIGDDRLYAKIISNTEEGAVSLDELSATVCIKPEALRKIITKGIKKGYITADKIEA